MSQLYVHEYDDNSVATKIFPTEHKYYIDNEYKITSVMTGVSNRRPGGYNSASGGCSYSPPTGSNILKRNIFTKKSK